MYLVIAGKFIIECSTLTEAMEVYKVHTGKTKSYKVRLVAVLEVS